MKSLLGKVIIKINLKEKEKYALTDDITISWERGYDFNLRQDRPSLAEIIDGEDLPKGTDVLVNYLAIEPVYEILEEEILTQHEKKQGFKIFSIPNDMCFAYHHKGEWHPCKEYLLTMRIFKPYTGRLSGITPTLVKNRMYVVKGFSEGSKSERIDLSGKVAVTLDWADYEIIWTDKENKEQHLIRTRDREVSGIDKGLLKDLKKGEYIIGISATTAKKLKK